MFVHIIWLVHVAMLCLGTTQAWAADLCLIAFEYPYSIISEFHKTYFLSMLTCNIALLSWLTIKHSQ